MTSDQAMSKLKCGGFEFINDAADLLLIILKDENYHVELCGPAVCGALHDSVINRLELSNDRGKLVGTYFCECHHLDDRRHVGDSIPFSCLNIYERIL